MKDYELLEEIRKSADSCQIPDRLKKENLNLEELPHKPERENGNRGRWRYVGAGAAAAMIVLVAAFIGLQRDGNGEEQTAKNSAGASSVEEKEDLELYASAENYEQIYKLLDKSMENTFVAEGSVEEVEESAADGAVTSMAKASGDYSKTNIQTEGVDEGDIVKTDGKYLYIIKNSREVLIVRADGSKLNRESMIRPENDKSDMTICDLYIEGDRLQIICEWYENSLQEEADEVYTMNYRAITGVFTYSLKDKKNPEKIAQTRQDGSYDTSRKADGYLYVFTSCYPQKQNTVWSIPEIEGEKIGADQIYIPEPDELDGSQYMVMTSISDQSPERILDRKAILEHADRFYVSTDHIYLLSSLWESDTDRTAIASFHFADGEMTCGGAAIISGSVTDDFAVNADKGCLRVLTTQWSDDTLKNQVYILDEEMKIVGRICDLAEGEQIYAARFMGDIGYFVTYRQTDPLFSVDFSNPANPKILGELKMTGFSEYLHFYDESRLLGIGWETDPDTGERKGLKLSMFDVSDPTNVKELKRMVIKNIDYFPGEYDYKTILLDPETNLIGLATVSYDGSGEINSYMVFSYDEKEGFKQELAYRLGNENVAEIDAVRGAFIKDTFYVVSNGAVTAFDRKDSYKKTGELTD